MMMNDHFSIWFSYMEVNNDPDELSLCIRPGALHKQKGEPTYATVSFEVLQLFPLH